MDYVLVEDQVSVLYGPGPWKHRFIQNDVDNLEIDYKVSPTEPGSYLKIADNLEVYPASVTIPPFDGNYQELSGPFWVFDNQVASGTYTVKDRDLTQIKGNLKNILAAERYKKEVAGVKLVVQGVEVTLETDRDIRNLFVQKYSLMGEGDTSGWKFPEAWLTLTKEDLGIIIATGAAYIQAQFDWEKNFVDQLDAATSIEELKVIKDTFCPPQVNERGLPSRNRE